VAPRITLVASAFRGQLRDAEGYNNGQLRSRR